MSASQTKKKEPIPVEKPSEESDWLEQLSQMVVRFDRFGWDIFGALLAMAALISLMGLFGITSGSLLSPWVNSLRQWLGWGCYIVVLVALGMAIKALRRQILPGTGSRLGKILAREGLFFCFLGLMTFLGGFSLPRVESGLDGGIVGWGLLSIIQLILPAPWSGILLGILVLICAIFGFGVDDWISRWAEGVVAETNVQKEQENGSELVSEQPVSENIAAAIKKPRPQRPAVQTAVLLPPAAKSLQRDENLPPLNLLLEQQKTEMDDAQVQAIGKKIEDTLGEFGIPARVIGYRVGPTVTQYAVEPGFVDKLAADGSTTQQKVRVAQISGLQRDLARALMAKRLRIEAPVPGRPYVGIEVPNPANTVVRMRPILESEAFQKLRSPLAIALGQNVSGQAVVADLARMPHMLIAGTTGSGKSVCIAALTTCLVMNNSPEDLRLAMLDPKMVELVRFNGLPHLLGKVETETERMIAVLRWALVEMDNRYRLLESAHARDLESYNRKMERKGQPRLPRIVLLVDELADLMMSEPDQTEHSIVRLAQMARATGIHLVVATQRPSTDVVTGLIKANFPARIAFTVAASVDSRVILDMNGAETLLGRGDLLFLNPEVGTLQRAQGALVTDQEVDAVIGFWKKTLTEETLQPSPWESLLENSSEEEGDGLADKAIELVRRSQRASASFLQRRLRIGYPRAARLLDELEEMGIVGPSQGGGKDREVLVPPDGEGEFDGEAE